MGILQAVSENEELHEPESCQESEEECRNHKKREHPVKILSIQFPYARNMLYVHGKSKDEKVMPRIEESQKTERYHTYPTHYDEHRLINPGSFFSEPYRDCHPILGIGLHVPYIVHVQNPDAEKPDRGGGKKEYP